MNGMSTTPEELYMLIGERELIKYKLQQQIKELHSQIDEMATVITKLREENGRLVKPADNDAIRRLRFGGEGEGRRRGDDVLVGPYEPAGGSGEARPGPDQAPGVGRSPVER